jgi:hypothetical protein
MGYRLEGRERYKVMTLATHEFINRHNRRLCLGLDRAASSRPSLQPLKLRLSEGIESPDTG